MTRNSPKNARSTSLLSETAHSAGDGDERKTKIAPARSDVPPLIGAARAPIHLSEINPLVAASGGYRFDGHVTLAVPDPRIRRLVGHPAMARAIRAALRALNAAISEFLTCRVANRPAASAFVDILEPNLQHLADLGFGKKPCRLPFAREGGDDGAPPRRLCNARRSLAGAAAPRSAGMLAAPSHGCCRSA